MGEISIDTTDPDGCTFTIAVKNRPYYLRAEDKARCNDWVIVLNRAREARMNVGNIQLAAPSLEGGVGGTHRSQAGSDDYSPCIVISANRPRTRAVAGFDGVPDLLASNEAGEEQEQIEVVEGSASHVQGLHHQTVLGVMGAGHISSPLASMEPVAKWQKRHSRLHVLSLRFLKWARSITNQADACRRAEGDVVVVPKHVVMAAQQHAMIAASEADTARKELGGATAAVGEKQPSEANMPTLTEEGQPPKMAPGGDSSDPPDNAALGVVRSDSMENRSRANTDSPAFRGSTYV